jgi:hypothetical protein
MGAVFQGEVYLNIVTIASSNNYVSARIPSYDRLR